MGDTFTVIHEYHVDESTTHLNSLDYNIKFTTELEQDGRLPFLDACVNINEDGSTHVIVYGELTHTDQYLNFSSIHHLQHKRCVHSWGEQKSWSPALIVEGRRWPTPKTPWRPMSTNNGCSRSRHPSNNRALHQPELTLMLACRACRTPPRHSDARVFKAHGVGTYNRHIN